MDCTSAFLQGRCQDVPMRFARTWRGSGAERRLARLGSERVLALLDLRPCLLLGLFGLLLERLLRLQALLLVVLQLSSERVPLVLWGTFDRLAGCLVAPTDLAQEVVDAGEDEVAVGVRPCLHGD